MRPNIPTPERLRERLLYYPETGKFFWKYAPDLPASWNAKSAGKEAFCTLGTHAYLTGGVDGVPIRAHRAAWAYVYGVWPDDAIDHVNGLRTDNRIENLRDVSHRENNMNMRCYRSNSSGVTGVYWNKRARRWAATVGVRGRSIHLGYFAAKDDAVAARLAANERHGFHAGHGKVIAS